jgi:hypothetical protein
MKGGIQNRKNALELPHGIEAQPSMAHRVSKYNISDKRPNRLRAQFWLVQADAEAASDLNAGTDGGSTREI